MSSHTVAESIAVAHAASPTGAAGEYLIFHLGAEEYGIDILRVQAIRGYEPPTRIASAPPFIKGVLNLRDVIELIEDQIKPSPPFGAIVDADHIVGIGAIRQGERERLLILMDIEKLMTGPELGLL